MMKMKKMLFVFNPRSGKEAIKNQLSDILGIFCGAGYLPSVYVTQEPGMRRRLPRNTVRMWNFSSAAAGMER